MKRYRVDTSAGDGRTFSHPIAADGFNILEKVITFYVIEPATQGIGTRERNVAIVSIENLILISEKTDKETKEPKS